MVFHCESISCIGYRRSCRRIALHGAERLYLHVWGLSTSGVLRCLHLESYPPYLPVVRVLDPICCFPAARPLFPARDTWRAAANCRFRLCRAGGMVSVGCCSRIPVLSALSHPA